MKVLSIAAAAALVWAHPARAQGPKPFVRTDTAALRKQLDAIAANSEGIDGVPLSQRQAPFAYCMSFSNANGRACACHPVNAGASCRVASDDA